MLQLNQDATPQLPLFQQLPSAADVNVKLETGLDAVQDIFPHARRHHGPVPKCLHLVDPGDWYTAVYRPNMPILDAFERVKTHATNGINAEDFEKLFFPHPCNLYRVTMDDFKQTEASHTSLAIWWNKYDGYSTIHPDWHQRDAEKVSVKKLEWDLQDYTTELYELLLMCAHHAPFDPLIFGALFLGMSMEGRVHIQFTEGQLFRLLRINVILFRHDPRLATLCADPKSWREHRAWPKGATFPTTPPLEDDHIAELCKGFNHTTVLTISEVNTLLWASQSSQLSQHLTAICDSFRENGKNCTIREIIHLKQHIINIAQSYQEFDLDSLTVILTAFYINFYHAHPLGMDCWLNASAVIRLAERYLVMTSQDFPGVLITMLFHKEVSSLSDIQCFGERVQRNGRIPQCMWFKFMNLLRQHHTLTSPSPGDDPVSFIKWLLTTTTQPIDKQLFMNINKPEVFFDNESDLYKAHTETFNTLQSPIISYNARVLFIAISMLTQKDKTPEINAQLVTAPHEVELDKSLLLHLLKFTTSPHEFEVYHATQLLVPMTTQCTLDLNDIPQLIEPMREFSTNLIMRISSAKSDLFVVTAQLFIYLNIMSWLLEEQISMPQEMLLLLPKTLAGGAKVLKATNERAGLYFIPQCILAVAIGVSFLMSPGVYDRELENHPMNEESEHLGNNNFLPPNLVVIQFLANLCVFAEEHRRASPNADMKFYERSVEEINRRLASQITNLEPPRSSPLSHENRTEIIKDVCDRMQQLYEMNPEKYHALYQLITCYLHTTR